MTYADVLKEGDGRDGPRERILTNSDDYGLKERLDYIFVVNPHKPKPDDAENDDLEKGTECASGLKVDVSKTMIEPFFTSQNKLEFPFTQFSDHYGVSTEINLI